MPAGTSNGFWARKTIDGLDWNGLLKKYATLMEDKMVARESGQARNYGWDSSFKSLKW